MNNTEVQLTKEELEDLEYTGTRLAVEMKSMMNKIDSILNHDAHSYIHYLHDLHDMTRPGNIFLVRYKSDNEYKLALHHDIYDVVFIYDEDSDDNHISMSTKEFCDKFEVITIYKCSTPFIASVASCIAFESLDNMDYYNILMGSFLNKDYEKYTLEDLIETGYNPWFDTTYKKNEE